VLSAYREAFEEVERMGVKRFLTKPVSLETLLSVVADEC